MNYLEGESFKHLEQANDTKPKKSNCNITFVVGRFSFTFKSSAGRTKGGNMLVPLLGFGYGKKSANLYILGFSIMVTYLK